MKCTPSDSPMILVSGNLARYDLSKNSQGGTPWNVPIESGVGFLAIFDQYVANRHISKTVHFIDKVSRPSCHITVIGNHRQAIEW